MLFCTNSSQPTLTCALLFFLLFKCFMIPRSSAVFFSAGLSPSSPPPTSTLPNPFSSLRPPLPPPPPPLTSVFFLWGLTVLFCTVGWIPGIRPPLITYYLCGKKASEAQICRGFESNWFTGKLLKRELGLAFPDGCSRRQKEPTVRVSLVSKLAIIPRAHNQKFLGW